MKWSKFNIKPFLLLFSLYYSLIQQLDFLIEIITIYVFACGIFDLFVSRGVISFVIRLTLATLWYLVIFFTIWPSHFVIKFTLFKYRLILLRCMKTLDALFCSRSSFVQIFLGRMLFHNCLDSLINRFNVFFL